MLKDHVDFDQLTTSVRDYIAGKAESLPTIATWRPARSGEVCGGCKRPLRHGSLVMEALADGSVGHARCHTGGRGLTVRGGR